METHAGRNEELQLSTLAGLLLTACISLPTRWMNLLRNNLQVDPPTWCCIKPRGAFYLPFPISCFSCCHNASHSKTQYFTTKTIVYFAQNSATLYASKSSTQRSTSKKVHSHRAGVLHSSLHGSPCGPTFSKTLLRVCIPRERAIESSLIGHMHSFCCCLFIVAVNNASSQQTLYTSWKEMVKSLKNLFNGKYCCGHVCKI